MPKSSRKEEILEHATRQATQVGLEGLSIGQLAKELEMSKSGLISHFDTKEGLQLDVLDYAADRFSEEALRPALKQPRGEARLRAVFTNWLSWFIDNPFGYGCLFAAVSSEFDDVEGPVHDKIAAHQQDLSDLVANVVRTGLSEGQFRPDTDAEQVAFELKGIMLAFHHSHRLLQQPNAKQRAVQAFERLLTSLRI